MAYIFKKLIMSMKISIRNDKHTIDINALHNKKSEAIIR